MLGVAAVCIGAFVGAYFISAGGSHEHDGHGHDHGDHSHDHGDHSHDHGSPAPPEGATIISGQQTWWADQGFVSLTPPVHLPGGTGGRSTTRIWLKIPKDGVIKTVEGPHGQLTLDYPKGTISDRVEYWRPKAQAPYRVADVRGTEIGADGAQTFRVFRPVGPGAEADLFGYTWLRGDQAVKGQVHEAIYGAMRQGVGFPWKTRPKRRKKAIKVYRARSDCAGCHTSHRPEITTGPSPINVNRGTDAVGFFTPKTLLVDHAPLEGYRPDDPNAADPCVSVTCPSGAEVQRITTDKGTKFQCPEREVPLGRFDLQCALTSDDKGVRQHADAMCDGRAFLYNHLDARGRQAFAKAFTACGIPDKRSHHAHR